MSATAIEEFERHVEQLIKFEAALLRFDHGAPGDTLSYTQSLSGDIERRGNTFLCVVTMRRQLDEWAKICKLEAREICDQASRTAVYRDLDKVVSATKHLPDKESLEELKLQEQSRQRNGFAWRRQRSPFFGECYERRKKAVEDALNSEALQDFKVLSDDPKHNGRRERISSHRYRMERELLKVSKDLLIPLLPPELSSKLGLTDATEAVAAAKMLDGGQQPSDAAKKRTSQSDGQELSPKNPVVCKRMDKNSADLIARQLDKSDPTFKHGNVELWAKRIRDHQIQKTGLLWSCSTTTVHATDFWDEVMKESGRGRRARSVKTVAFSGKTEATVEGSDSVLNELAAKEDQCAIDAVMQSGMKDDAKAATVEKIRVGEMTTAEALKMAELFPKRSKAKKSLIRE